MHKLKININAKKGTVKVRMCTGDKVIKFTYELNCNEITSGDLSKMLSVIETLRK